MVFERFTDRARQVVVLAQVEARKLNHNYIGTEHFLLGMLHEGEGVASQALTSLGVDSEKVRDAVLAKIGEGQQAPSGHIPFTPRLKKVLELSLREALQLGHNYIGTEHLLLAVVREGEGTGAQILIESGAELNLVRQRVIQIISGYTGHYPTSEKAEAWEVFDKRPSQVRAIEVDFSVETAAAFAQKLTKFPGVHNTAVQFNDDPAWVSIEVNPGPGCISLRPHRSWLVAIPASATTPRLELKLMSVDQFNFTYQRPPVIREVVS